MKKVLFLFTSHFPYDQGEEFLETEIAYLSIGFDQVLIVPRQGKRITRKIPANTSIIQYNSPNNNFFGKILKGLRYLFDTRFLEEIKTIIFNYQKFPSFLLIKQMMEFLIKADHLSKFLNQKIQELAKAAEGLEIYLFSYWMDYEAFAVANTNMMENNHLPIKKSFCRAHGHDLYFERNKLNYLPFRKFIIKNLDMVFTHSEDGKNYLIKKFGNNISNKIQISKIGIENPFPKSGYSTNGKFRLVSCSFMVEVKRIGLIIDALSGIDGFCIKWIHIGDGGLKQDLQQYAAKKLGKNPFIDFTFLGYLENHDVYKFYSENTIDAFINLSRSEGLPVTMMEAMSFSIPVIATDVGGVNEIVNNENGILLSSNPSCEEIQKAIISFYNLSIEEKIQFREKAYTTWEQSYKASKNYKNFLRLIKNQD